MTRTVAVVDYGMGNLRSVSQAVLHVAAGTGSTWSSPPTRNGCATPDRVVLPGQGALPDCMRELRGRACCRPSSRRRRANR